MTTTPPSPRLPPRLLLLLLLLLVLSLEQLRMVGAWVAPPPRPPAATTLQQRRHRQQQRARGRGHLLQASASEEEEETGGRHTRADAVRLGFLGGAAAAVWSSMGLAAAAPVIAAVPGKGKEGQNQQMAGPTFREKGRPALVEALVYLPKGINYWGELLPAGEIAKEEEGGGSDGDSTTGAEALFLTASYEGRLVLGARVPMQGVAFPFLAQFYPGNVIPAAGRSAQETWEAVKDKDLVVRARVCATGEYPPCETPLLRAASLSKFLPVVRDPNAKGQGDGDGDGAEAEVIARNVRIGASLMLRPPGEATTLEEMKQLGALMTTPTPQSPPSR